MKLPIKIKKPKAIKPITTVNVMEDADGEINMTSFPDNPAGNRAAVELFRQISLEQEFNDLEIAEGIEWGLIDRPRDSYALYLIHSS